MSTRPRTALVAAALPEAGASEVVADTVEVMVEDKATEVPAVCI